MNGELYVKTELRGDRTEVTKRYFKAPLKIAKPFRGEDGSAEIIVMCASPGLLDGDSHSLRFDCMAGAKTAVGTQSCQKLFRAGVGATSSQTLKINVGEDAEFFYLPHPTIPFAGSSFRSDAEINLEPSSKLFYCDILTCGRAAMGERFAFKDLRSRLSVTVGGRLAFLDGARLTPKNADVSGLGFFEGYSCQALIYMHGFEPERMEMLRGESEGNGTSVALALASALAHKTAASGFEAAVSNARMGVSIRALGHGADEVFEFARAVWALVKNR